jgi:hypothetical protein
MYYLAFLQGDSAQMERQVAWGAGKPGDEDRLLSAQSFQKFLDHPGVVLNFLLGSARTPPTRPRLRDGR